jgi:alkaline phosphatase
MTRFAISTLNHNLNGYFLVVSHGLVARASEQNLGKLAVNEVAVVDEAIESAVQYAGPDALILVTNSYNLGAVGTLSPSDTLAVGPPSPSPNEPAWLAGPGGPAGTRAQKDWLAQRFTRGWFSSAAPGLLQPQSAFRFQTEATPTAGPAWLASRGEGSAQLRGFFNNTDVFDLVNEQF